MDQIGEQRLKVTEANWEEKPGSNGYLLRQLYDLLLREPEDLTDEDAPSTMEPESTTHEGGGVP